MFFPTILFTILIICRGGGTEKMGAFLSGARLSVYELCRRRVKSFVEILKKRKISS